MTPVVLSFSPQGVASCLYTEAIDLSTLGPLQVTRATHIEFNSSSQAWEVMDIEGHVLFVHHSRQACLDWEQRHFNSIERNTP